MLLHVAGPETQEVLKTLRLGDDIDEKALKAIDEQISKFSKLKKRLLSKADLTLERFVKLENYGKCSPSQQKI